MTQNIDSLILEEMSEFFYEGVVDRNIDLTQLPTYDPLKVISSMLLAMEKRGTDDGWITFAVIVGEALENHRILSNVNLVDRVEYLTLRLQAEEYSDLKRVLQKIIRED
ncbi:hypothetical protein Javan174_0019 [Streptococcus phage Javan174]|uniref:hypothetical protein n=1 Tax=Streptococcus entericus TaxID=155680 RepID=UPI0003811A22|nr:hypothetical protein [Streptococcus entericus]QBX24085.1 hypothetical protein Javan174_0019 [Streptococcus phage Javan174]